MPVVAERASQSVTSPGVAARPTHTPVRNFRMRDNLWLPAARIAFLRKESLTRVFELALTRYVSRHRDLIENDPRWDERAAWYKAHKSWDLPDE